jgi:hypothetical protein
MYSLTPSRNRPRPSQSLTGLRTPRPITHTFQSRKTGLQHVVPLGGSTNGPISYTVLKIYNVSTRSYGTDILILQSPLRPQGSTLLSYFSYQSEANLGGTVVVCSKQDYIQPL